MQTNSQGNTTYSQPKQGQTAKYTSNGTIITGTVSKPSTVASRCFKCGEVKSGWFHKCSK